ncbi:MAG TPA: DUF2892 domain-containing protein [Candidatus Saccharimonadales bacterium]|jgi:hypothetical protein|nr:DUF2892 domain-containing protein [Candidatus Saccharimonadales bacterium]
MVKNVGGMERGIRLLIGIALLALAFFHVIAGTAAIAAYIAGAVAIITGLAQYCPAWSIFGINTCHAVRS